MVLASNNKGKINEIKEILGIEIKSLSESNIDLDVEEDKESFYGNAAKKAREIYNMAKDNVIADDSGLCINSLDGFPGILTHRFLGDGASDEDRNLFLINKLEGVEDRTAKVVCNLVYYDGINEIVGEGILEGKITLTPRGNNGFGFDSIFEIEDGRTLAEMSMGEKNKISARFLAIQDLKKKMEKSGKL